MTELPSDIISDAEIERVHGYANFGGIKKRTVVDEGVLKYAFGYSGGSTQLSILLEHGLIRKPRSMHYDSDLTKKGKRYLRAVFGGHFIQIVALPSAANSNLSSQVPA
jgi:hypothetical protein